MIYLILIITLVVLIAVIIKRFSKGVTEVGTNYVKKKQVDWPNIDLEIIKFMKEKPAEKGYLKAGSKRQHKFIPLIKDAEQVYRSFSGEFDINEIEMSLKVYLTQEVAGKDSWTENAKKDYRQAAYYISVFKTVEEMANKRIQQLKNLNKNYLIEEKEFYERQSKYEKVLNETNFFIQLLQKRKEMFELLRKKDQAILSDIDKIPPAHNRKLRLLQESLDSGVISESEFNRNKANIINSGRREIEENIKMKRQEIEENIREIQNSIIELKNNSI